jgi:hypothetical protein
MFPLMVARKQTNKKEEENLGPNIPFKEMTTVAFLSSLGRIF